VVTGRSPVSSPKGSVRLPELVSWSIGHPSAHHSAMQQRSAPPTPRRIAPGCASDGQLCHHQPVSRGRPANFHESRDTSPPNRRGGNTNTGSHLMTLLGNPHCGICAGRFDRLPPSPEGTEGAAKL